MYRALTRMCVALSAVVAVSAQSATLLDAAAVTKCLPLHGDQREEAIALAPDGSVLPVGIDQRQSRGVIYTRLSVPVEAAALCHSHPGDGGTILPGPKDWAAVKANRPSYISHNGKLIVLELYKGVYYSRIVTGTLSSKELRKLHRSTRRANQ